MPQPQAPRPHRPHPRLPAATLTAVACIWMLAAAAAVAQPFAVTGYSPTNGSEGTQVDIFGGPFSTNPDDHAAFIDGGAGLGVVLDGDSSTAGAWTGTLGPAAAPFFGSVTVWRGQRYIQAPVVYAGVGGTAYWIDRAEWFVPRRRSAVGPGLFHVTSSSGGTAGGLGSQTGLQVDIVDFIIDGGHPYRIDLNVMIDGGSSGGNNDDPDPGRMVILGMSIAEGLTPSAADLAVDLAGALSSRFGAFGLKAEAQGTTLTVSFAPYPVSRGFAVLSSPR
ncbi:MAG: hypothetical protein AAFX50_05380 [Acidobacteriota bacterium]